MRVHCLPVACSLFLTAALPARLPAQQATPTPQVFWAVSYYQVDWPKVDSLMKLVRAYTLPTVDEAKKMGVLLDYRILIHDWAGRDNVVIMQKFSRFGAIHDDTSFRAAYHRLVPDSTKRKTINDAFSSIFGGGLHRDEIYTEVTKQ
jgi:hypothetical protein